MERRVKPWGTMLISEYLKPLHEVIGDQVARFLVSRIAVVNPAAQRPRFASRAQIVLLERAEVRRDRLLVRRGTGQQNLGLQVAQDHDMAILLQAAAAAARQPHRAGGSHALT